MADTSLASISEMRHIKKKTVFQELFFSTAEYFSPPYLKVVLWNAKVLFPKHIQL